MDEGTSISHWYESYQTTETESNILVRNRIHALATLCHSNTELLSDPGVSNLVWGLPQTPVGLEPPKSEA